MYDLAKVEEFAAAQWKELQASTGRRLAGEESNRRLYGTAGTRFGTRGGGQLFFAPQRHVYDARLVEALYSFAGQGALLRSVKLFTTTIVQLQVLGLNPPSSGMQHLGVTL